MQHLHRNADFFMFCFSELLKASTRRKSTQLGNRKLIESSSGPKAKLLLDTVHFLMEVKHFLVSVATIHTFLNAVLPESGVTKI